MRLTWKDAVATVAMGVITAVYVVFLQQADVFVLSSVRGAAIVILLVGGAGGATAALWLVATLRHAFMQAPEPVRDRDTHEVIRQVPDAPPPAGSGPVGGGRHVSGGGCGRADPARQAARRRPSHPPWRMGRCHVPTGRPG
ncbi:hypothetical protein [Nonomuraea sp. NPDC048826]|uniref:hypothetical protein n=1 Tax=Nonomuraea sp. NPDC048826 TaxID=3364347 RepID=UPI0037167A0A